MVRFKPISSGIHFTLAKEKPRDKDFKELLGFDFRSLKVKKSYFAPLVKLRALFADYFKRFGGRNVFYDLQESYRKGDLIYISYLPIKTMWEDDGYLLQNGYGYKVLTGLFAHELGHFFYSRKLSESLRKKVILSNFYAHIFNIVEDERIERLLVKENSLLGNWLVYTKEWFFGSVIRETSEIKRSGEREIIEKALIVLGRIRYPSENFLGDLPDRYEEFSNWLDDIVFPYPETIDEAEVLTDKIVAKILDEKEENLISILQSEGVGNSLERVLESSKQLREIIKSMSKDLGRERERSLVQPAKDVFDYRVLAVNAGYSDMTEDDILRLDVFNKVPHTEKLREAYNEIVEENKEEISWFRNSFAVRFRNNVRNSYGLYQGEFDDDAIVDAFIGAKNVYQDKKLFRNQGIIMGILLDVSGSMRGWKIKEVREFVITLYEALHYVRNVKMIIHSHTTIDFDDCPTLIEEYFNSFTDKFVPYSLAGIKAKYHNRDGSAIKFMAEYMHKFYKGKKLIISISDGEPWAPIPSGFTNKGWLRKGLKEAKAYNCEVIHIGVGYSGETEDVYDKELFVENFKQAGEFILRNIQKVMAKY